MVSAVVAIGMVTSGVATMPGGISIERVVVVDDGTSCPISSPRVPAPASGRPCPECDTSAERDRARRCYIGCTVSRRYIRVSVDHGGIVLRNVDNVRVRRLNHDRL